ncbi:MAG TPA: hypothetical protein VF974_08225 [Patescibacteria group bacterium]
MAFSATVRGTSYFGDGVRSIYGDWTGAVGDAAGTLALAGGYPILAIFQKFDTLDNTFQIIPRVEVSTTSGITTYTIENQDTVATGRFFILHKGQ